MKIKLIYKIWNFCLYILKVVSQNPIFLVKNKFYLGCLEFHIQHRMNRIRIKVETNKTKINK